MHRFTLAVIIVILLTLGACSSKRAAGPASVQSAQVSAVSLEAAKAYEAGEMKKSLELYRSLLAEEPDNHIYINNMGVLLLKAGRAKESLKNFEKASMLAPQQVEYLINAGLAQISLKEYDQALDFYDLALHLSPLDPRVFYGKGLAYLSLDEPEIALGLFHRAVALESDNPRYMFMRAYASQKNGLWEDAVEDYSMLIGYSQDRTLLANAHSNRGLCYFQLKDFENGMMDLEQALEINDTIADYYYNRAQGYQMQHRYDEAVKDYTRAIARKVGFPEAYINRGELNYLSGREAKGCADLKRACDLGYCGPLETYKQKEKCTD